MRKTGSGYCRYAEEDLFVAACAIKNNIPFFTARILSKKGGRVVEFRQDIEYNL